MAYLMLYASNPSNILCKTLPIVQETNCVRYFAAVCPKYMLGKLSISDDVKRSRFYSLDTAYLDPELVQERRF